MQKLSILNDMFMFNVYWKKYDEKDHLSCPMSYPVYAIKVIHLLHKVSVSKIIFLVEISDNE